MNTTQGINSSDVTVLLVDDNHVNNKLVASILMPQAYNIYVADKGKDGIKMARDLLPDVILLDIMMPEIDGFQVCKHLQDDSLTREIPVIFITADSSVKAQTKAFQMGGSDFITKPIVDVVLIERINNQVRLSRNKKELSTLNNYHDLAETLFHSGFWAFHNVDGIVDSTFSKHLTSILEVHDINTEFQFAPELITVLLSDSKDTITHGEYLARWTQVLTFGGVFDEVCNCTVGSQKKFLRIRAEFVREDANDLAGFGAIQDVTDIIRTENELADLKAKLANSNTRQNLIETNTQLAHELNQPLAAINLNVNYVKQLLNADPLDLSKLKESLADVSSDVTRATNIVKNIRRIVKKEPAFI